MEKTGKLRRPWGTIGRTAGGWALAVVMFFQVGILGNVTQARGRVDINSAGISELETLPYIGRQRAEAIVNSRRQVGPFRSTRDLLKRKLIGEETFKAIEGSISLYAVPAPRETAPLTITNIHIDGTGGEIFLLENQNFARVLAAKILEAEETIRIVTFLFKTSENRYNYATQLAEALIKAQKRGVQVEIILELSDYNHSLNESNEYTMKRLKDAGIRIRFDSIERQTHTKLAIVDERFTMIGSHNLSHSALGINNELSLMIDSEAVAKKALAYFRSIQ